MPLALTFAGIVLVLVGVRNTYGEFGSALREEFVGPANFGYRAGAILMVGVIGYAGDRWRELSVALMALLTLGLLVTIDSDFFGKLGEGIKAAPQKAGSSGSRREPGAAPVSASPSIPNILPQDGSDPLKTGADILKTVLPLVL